MLILDFLHSSLCLRAFQSMFLAAAFTISADTPHKVSDEQSKGLVLHYTLKDLGETDLKPDNLTRQQEGLSQGPAINDYGDVIGNRSSGGFCILQNGCEYAPRLQGARFNFYSINNRKDVLFSISRGASVDWFIWAASKGWQGRRISIDPVELEGNIIFLAKINDLQKVIGAAKPDNRSMPLEWDPQRGLRRVGFEQRENLHGTVNDINSRDTIAGKLHRHQEDFPYAMLDGRQLNLFKLRRQFQAPSDGKIVFEDLVLNDGDHIYGTYWIDRHFDDPKADKVKDFRAFKWVPAEGALTLLDIDGMRISAINNRNILVGSHKGQASFREGSFKPISIISAIDVEETKGWHLLEATDINDEGQIVGYGIKDGAMHLFLAEPRVDKTLTEKLPGEVVDAAIIH